MGFVVAPSNAGAALQALRRGTAMIPLVAIEAGAVGFFSAVILAQTPAAAQAINWPSVLLAGIGVFGAWLQQSQRAKGLQVEIDAEKAHNAELKVQLAQDRGECLAREVARETAHKEEVRDARRREEKVRESLDEMRATGGVNSAILTSLLFEPDRLLDVLGKLPQPIRETLEKATKRGLNL